MIDVSDHAAVVAEAERRKRLLAQGVTRFTDLSGAPIRTERVIDEAELGRLEKEIEHACDKLTLALGGRVIRFSHPGKTKQTPGVADRIYAFPRLRLASWWELKTPDNQQSPPQRDFEALVTACGQEYHAGGLGDYKQWLLTRGVVAGFHADGTPIPHPIGEF